MEKEVMEAAVAGIREYLRTNRGVDQLGPDADVQPTGKPWEFQIVHKGGTMFISLLSM